MTITPRLPFGERVYAIGDVHGRADLLAELLDAIRRDNDARPASRVRIILLGDLIDRGPASADIVASCRELVDRHDCFIVLKGNHEAMMVDAVQGSVPAFAFWLGQGGDATLASWGVSADLVAEGPSRALMTAARASVPPELIAWLAGLPLYHQCGNCLFVHAGIRPGVRLTRQKALDLLWIRHDFTEDTTPRPFVVVHGHTIDETGPRLDHGRLGIDTGAYRTGRLTAVGIEGEEYWSLSTDRSPIAPGDVPLPRQSVETILDSRSGQAPSSPLPVRTRTLATSTAIVAALLVAGTTAIVRWHGSNSPAITPPRGLTSLRHPTGVEERPREKATTYGSASPSRPATSVEYSDTTKDKRAVIDLALRDAERTSSSRPDQATAPALVAAPGSIRPGNRSTPMRLAGEAPPSPVQRVLVAPPPPPLSPPARLDAAALAASAGPPPNRGLVAGPAILEERPPKRPSETAKERVEAIDAIRLLRRQ